MKCFGLSCISPVYFLHDFTEFREMRTEFQIIIIHFLLIIYHKLLAIAKRLSLPYFITVLDERSEERQVQ